MAVLGVEALEEQSHCVALIQGQKRGQAFDVELFPINLKDGIGGRGSVRNNSAL